MEDKTWDSAISGSLFSFFFKVDLLFANFNHIMIPVLKIKITELLSILKEDCSMKWLLHINTEVVKIPAKEILTSFKEDYLTAKT